MMKLRLTVYCYRTYFHGACAPNLSLYLYLSLTACQNTVQFIKNIINMCACTVSALTTARSHTRSHNHIHTELNTN